MLTDGGDSDSVTGANRSRSMYIFSQSAAFNKVDTQSTLVSGLLLSAGHYRNKLECGPMPNVIVGVGRPAEYRFNAAVWLTPTTRVPCSNAAKTRNPLKLPGVPQTNETISAASGPKFTILWCGDMQRRYCCLTSFSDCRYMP